MIDKKKKNYGIALLRVILSFMVILDHFYDKERKKAIINIIYYHIPTFFLLSFYFNYNSFATFNISKIKLRFERLSIPYFCWSLISLILNNIYFYLLKRKCRHTLYDFLDCLLNGRDLIVSLWFQNILILTTLIISIVLFSFKNEYILIFHILMILAYILQYSGKNLNFFNTRFNPTYLNTYGRLINTFPDSLTGFFLPAYNIINKLILYKKTNIIISLIIIIFLSKYEFDNNLFIFKYGGIRLNIASVCIFFIFYSLGGNIRNKKTIKIFDIITNYTPGIYFIHNLIGRGYIIPNILGNKLKTFFGCLVIYLVCFILCFLLDQLLGKTRFIHLIK